MGHELIALFSRYGYAAVFVLVMLEDFGVPVPGETALIAAAVAAASGKLSIWGVLVAALAGAIIGDNIGYAIGHFAGRRVVVRVGGRFFGLTEAKFAHAEATFRRRGEAIVVVARFIEVLRQLNGVIAGTMGMRWRTFLAFNALGAALWVSAWAAVGFFAGEHLAAIEYWIRRFSWLALIVVAAAAVVWLLLKRRNAVHEGEPAEQPERR
jgi:membrane protein DedA with SNARE-associated domain